jgi:hypothetical protein
MIRAKVNAEAREMLLGHSIGLTTAYYRPDESELLSEYLKAVDLLTINPENRLRLTISLSNLYDVLPAILSTTLNFDSDNYPAVVSIRPIFDSSGCYSPIHDLETKGDSRDLDPSQRIF